MHAVTVASAFQPTHRTCMCMPCEVEAVYSAYYESVSDGSNELNIVCVEWKSLDSFQFMIMSSYRY